MATPPNTPRRRRQSQEVIADRYIVTSRTAPGTTMGQYTIRDRETGAVVGHEHQWPSLAVAQDAARHIAAGRDPDPLGTYAPRKAPADSPF